MHEYSLVQSLIGKVETEARARGATAVRRVALRVGELAGVDPELLATAFDLVCGRGELAGGGAGFEAAAREHALCREAVLEVERVPLCWECRVCGRSIAAGAVLRCPDCGAPARLVSGDELLLTQIDLEVP